MSYAAVILIALFCLTDVQDRSPAQFSDQAQERGIQFTPNQGSLSPFGDGLAFADLDDDGGRRFRWS